MRFWNSIHRVLAPFVSTPARRASPAACYYMLLSLLPSATILFGVSSYADNLQTHVVALLQSLIPEPFHQSIFQYLDASLKIRRRLPYSILLALWSSGKGIHAVTEGLYAAFQSYSDSDFFRKRIRAALHYLMILTALILVISLAILGEIILEILPFRNRTIVRIIINFMPMFIVTLLFYLLYHSLSKTKFWRPCLIGAIFAACGWYTVSALFSIYVNLYIVQAFSFGLPLFLSLLLWLKLCMDVLFFGAVLTSALSSGTYHPLQYLKEALFPRFSE